MKVTKYPQSCLLLEKDGKRIVIDPGDDFADQYGLAAIGQVEAVLYTHQHGDHLEQSLLEELRSKKICLYGNEAVCGVIGEGSCMVSSGSGFTVAGFAIMPHDLPHCAMPDGSDGPRNTGYVIDDNFFHPGDGFELAGLEVDHLAAPITGPDISFRDAFDFAKQVKAKKVIPIHNDKLGAKIEVFKMFGERFNMPFEVITLENGQSTEL